MLGFASVLVQDSGIGSLTAPLAKMVTDDCIVQKYSLQG